MESAAVMRDAQHKQWSKGNKKVSQPQPEKKAVAGSTWTNMLETGP